MQNAETVLGVLREQHSGHRSLESRILGNGSVRFGGRPHGKGPAQQAPRRAADPAVKVNGIWRYVYRAIDQHGQLIDVLLSPRRDPTAARRFFTRALRTLKVIPSEVVTDAAPIYPMIEELLPSAWHHVEQYENNPIEADYGQLKRRLRPDARTPNRSDRPSGHRRTCLRPEPAPRPLRHRTRHLPGH
jgi:hypothetical protein